MHPIRAQFEPNPLPIRNPYGSNSKPIRKMELNKYQSQSDFIHHSAKAIESVILEAIKKNKEVRIALSGGSSPKKVYEALSRSQKIDWDKVSVYLADERCVDKNSEESNAKMIKESLINKITVKHFYPFKTFLPIDKCLEDYEKSLHSIQKGSLFDLVILGLGADGHTASLFPNIPELDEEKKWVVHTQAKGYATEDRVSLTFPAILSSGRIIFLIQGNKDNVMQKWLHEEMDFHQLPAKKILDHSLVDILYFKGE